MFADGPSGSSGLGRGWVFRGLAPLVPVNTRAAIFQDLQDRGFTVPLVSQTIYRLFKIKAFSSEDVSSGNNYYANYLDLFAVISGKLKHGKLLSLVLPEIDQLLEVGSKEKLDFIGERIGKIMPNIVFIRNGVVDLSNIHVLYAWLKSTETT